MKKYAFAATCDMTFGIAQEVVFSFVQPESVHALGTFIGSVVFGAGVMVLGRIETGAWS